MPLKIPSMSLVLGSLILVSGTRADARGQAGAEPATPPLVLYEGSAKGRSAEARREIAEALIAQREAIMGRRLDAAFRARTIERVASQPVESLRLLRAGAGDGPALPDLLGDSGADLVYTPVAQCRIFDTRLAVGGMLRPDTPRDFFVAGAGFAAQGGNPSGCAVPLGPATAVVVNLAVVSPTGPGHLRAWAVAAPTPSAPYASVLNFGNVAGLQALANAVVLPICDLAAVGGCASDLRLQTFGSSAHVVGDVLGYFRGVELAAELLVGSDGFGPVPATAGSLDLGSTEVLTPGRLVDCVVTCSFTVTSSAPNVTGHASVQGGAKHVDTASTVWGGMPMSAAPVASAGASSATQTVQIGLGASLRFQFGCFVSAAGDFLGDEITGTVAWTCR
jgi:hypothetical protein